MKERKSLGELAVHRGFASKLQVEEALKLKQKKNIRIGDALIELGYINEDQRLELLSKFFRKEVIDLDEFVPDKNMLKAYEDPSYIYNNKFIPYKETDIEYMIIVVDPLNLKLEDELRKKFSKEIGYILGHEKKITKWLNNNLGSSKINEQLGRIKRDEDTRTVYDLDAETAGEGPVPIKVNSILKQAIIRGASDIHIMTIQDETQVRFRIDGILHEIERFSATSYESLLGRIQIMADIGMGKGQVPLDGKISAMLNGKPIDMRVSILPSLPKPKITIRILDTSNFDLNISNLGMLPDNEQRFRDVIENPTGIVLLTGPTGSGKSTTLFTVINTIKDVTKNIITAEDPVEYRMNDITQVQVNNAAGLSFGMILRSMLRQDPDVILIGEIRDKETAEIAVQAANTGHLVLSTLHTNDAASSLTRLINMGIAPYMLSDSLLAVVNQRLVRTLCNHCKQKYVLKKDSKLRKTFRIPGDEDIEMYHAVGCKKCADTGYSGRTALHEMIIVNEKIREILDNEVTPTELRNAAIESGMRTLRDDGIEKCKLGITSLEELRRLVNL